MSRWMWMAGLVAGLGMAPPAFAQNGSTPLPLPTRAQTPGLSPYLYLNNNRNGNNNGIDQAIGLGLLRAEQQRRQFESAAGTAITNLERGGLQSPTLAVPDLLPSLTTTGHQTFFNNTAGYFNNRNPVNPPAFGPLPSARSAPKR